MNQHTNFPASATAANTSRKRAIQPKHKWHLLKNLEAIKRTFDGSFFLDEAERRTLKPISTKRLRSGELKDFEVNFPVRAYPVGMKPRLTLNMIESKLKGNHYGTVDAFEADIGRLVRYSKGTWGEMHDITHASRKILSDVKESIKNLPTFAPTMPQPRKIAAAPTVDRSTTTIITSQQFSDLQSKIALTKRTCLFPHDNQRAISDLDNFGWDGEKYRSLEEVCDALERIFDESTKCNGPRHRVTFLANAVLKYAKTLLEEAKAKAETLELEKPSDEQLLDDVETVAAPDKPQAIAKKDLYVRQKKADYLAGKPRQHKTPRNLVTEKILKRTGELVEIESEDADTSEDEEGEEEVAAEDEDEDERGVCEAQLCTKEVSKDYTDDLRDLPEDPPTLEQIHALKEARQLGPNFLGRTASSTPGKRFGESRKTNGSTSQDFLLPAADTNEDYDQHAALEDLTQGEIMYMTGHHLAWADLRGDELLSYSTDMLFLVVHALGRANRGQGGVTIQFLDRRKVRTTDGMKTEFYHALDLYTIFKIPRWPGWRWKSKLHPRKFTHEYLSHGTLRCHDSTLKQATLEDLVRDGLYEIFPPFQTPENHKRVPLYRLQVIYRRIGYPPRFPRIGELDPPIYSYEDCPQVRAMTVELLQTVRKVTMNFRHEKDSWIAVEVEPPLHAFIGFLTFEKRQPADPVFTEWIKRHYTPQDVLDLYTDANANVNTGFAVVADNLPGVMQYLDLVRDCIAIFNLPRLPPDNVQHAHEFDGTMDRSFKYAACDDEWNKEYRETSIPYGLGRRSSEDDDHQGSD